MGRLPNNHILGNVLVEETQNCIFHSDNKLIAALGVDDLIVADTADALLIAKEDRAQQFAT